jgi:hypothetical protein
VGGFEGGGQCALDDGLEKNATGKRVRDLPITLDKLM